jgi:pimeloyl-ACP methyl ester carboxylesterase
MGGTSGGRLAEAAPTFSSAAVEDFHGLVDVGHGRHIHVECRGSGGPAVVLESGYRCGADTWNVDHARPDALPPMVFPRIAEFTRVLAYDRPGTLLADERRGRSDPVPMPRTAAEAVADLHALLTAADVPGPYVLVGHSYGGLLVRLFAATYPGDVAGLVLVDPSHEFQNERFLAVLTPAEQAALTRLETTLPPELADFSDLEVFDFAASSAQMREAASRQPLAVPLILLTRGRPFADDDPAEWEGITPAGVAAIEREGQRMDQELNSLIPDARHLIAAKSGHFIQVDEPELVIEAVRAVVEAVRDERRSQARRDAAGPRGAKDPALLQRKAP